MDKNDIIEYVMTTPNNTNRAVLSSMLNQLTEGGDDGGGSWTVLTEESVTTEASGSGLYETSLEYSELITADSVRITLNGVEYTCTNISEESDEGAYGAEIPDWSIYPFRLESSESPFGGVTNHIITESAGTYTIKIEVPQSDGSSDFSTATLTVINNLDADFAFHAPIIASSLTEPFFEFLGAGIYVNPSESQVYTLALYKGKALIDGFALGNYTITASGSIEKPMDGVYFATGDCNITLSSGGR